MVKAGQKYRMGRRLLTVVRVAREGWVRYWDEYPGGEAFDRTASLIQWDLGVEGGELVLVVPKKGGKRC